MNEGILAARTPPHFALCRRWRHALVIRDRSWAGKIDEEALAGELHANSNEFEDNFLPNERAGNSAEGGPVGNPFFGAGKGWQIPIDYLIPSAENRAQIPFDFNRVSHASEGFDIVNSGGLPLILQRNSSRDFPVCLTMYLNTKRVTSRWWGTQVVKTLPSAPTRLNVRCFPDLTRSNPLRSRTSMTLRCGSGRSFPMKNTLWHSHRHARHDHRSRKDCIQLGFGGVRISQVIVDQITHVVSYFLLGAPLRGYIEERAARDEPLALLGYDNGHGDYVHVQHHGTMGGGNLLICGGGGKFAGGVNPISVGCGAEFRRLSIFCENSSNEFCMQIPFDFNRISYANRQTDFVNEDSAGGPDFGSGGESRLFPGVVSTTGGGLDG